VEERGKRQVYWGGECYRARAKTQPDMESQSCIQLEFRGLAPSFTSPSQPEPVLGSSFACCENIAKMSCHLCEWLHSQYLYNTKCAAQLGRGCHNLQLVIYHQITLPRPVDKGNKPVFDRETFSHICVADLFVSFGLCIEAL